QRPAPGCAGWHPARTAGGTGGARRRPRDGPVAPRPRTGEAPRYSSLRAWPGTAPWRSPRRSRRGQDWLASSADAVVGEARAGVHAEAEGGDAEEHERHDREDDREVDGSH